MENTIGKILDRLDCVKMTNSHASNDSTVKMKYKAQNRRKYFQIPYLTDGIIYTRPFNGSVSTQ